LTQGRHQNKPDVSWPGYSGWHCVDCGRVDEISVSLGNEKTHPQNRVVAPCRLGRWNTDRWYEVVKTELESLVQYGAQSTMYFAVQASIAGFGNASTYIYALTNRG
jgi:hypothetical protein